MKVVSGLVFVRAVRRISHKLRQHKMPHIAQEKHGKDKNEKKLFVGFHRIVGPNFYFPSGNEWYA